MHHTQLRPWPHTNSRDYHTVQVKPQSTIPQSFTMTYAHTAWLPSHVYHWHTVLRVHIHTHTHTAYTHTHCHHIHHHTVQIAKCTNVFVHISKWASWHWKHHHQCKLQVMTIMSASEVFALVNGRNTPPAQVAGCLCLVYVELSGSGNCEKHPHFHVTL